MNEESHDNHLRAKPGPKSGHTVDFIKQGIVVGRNKVPVPPDEVEHLASLGCSDAEIARYFGVTDHSLRRHFAVNLVKGRHNLKLSLRQAQLRVALEGNPTMLIWLGRNLLQQNEAGTTSEEVRPLPWSDDIDEAVSDEDDVDLTQEDTEDAEDTDA
jgi:hypothetical protein